MGKSEGIKSVMQANNNYCTLDRLKGVNYYELNLYCDDERKAL